MRGFGLADAARAAQDLRRGPMVLTIDLTRPLRRETSGLAALRARGRPTLREVTTALETAAGDDRVVGMLARVGHVGTDFGSGLATVQELAAAVRRFVDSGRPCIAHAEAFGEGGNGTLSYLLASAFGEVHLQPSGELSLLGLSAEVTFLRGALDRVGVEPSFDGRHEYKSAADMLTEHGFTEAHREAIDGLVDDWSQQIVTAVATARGLEPSAVVDAMDTAPLLPDEAEQRGLVDRLAYLDESLDALRSRVDVDADLVTLDDYRRSVGSRRRWRERGAPQVAVLSAVGPITIRARAGLAGAGVTSDRLCAELRRAAQDDDVAAVVLHIDSPGGSAVASDAIRREVLRTRETGTPVIAWMGDVAASGGYYIAMAADRIVARPGTLTGSIGVISGKLVRTGLEDRLGVRTEAVTRGAHARFYSPSSPFSDSERARLDDQLDWIYDDFTSKVAQDRDLDVDHVRRVARGRIWSGAQAKGHGLVDVLGGDREVRAAVRAALGVQPDATLRMRPYPAPVSLLRRLRGHTPIDPAERDVAALLSAVAPDDVHGWLTALVAARRPPGALTLPFLPRLR